MASYYHGLFTLDVPEDWIVRDLSGAGAVIAQFVSPDLSRNILVFIRIPGAGEVTVEDLKAELETNILGVTYARTGENFELTAIPEEVDDLAVEAEFIYDEATPDGIHAMLGYAYAEFVDDRIVAVLSAIDEEFVDELQDEVDEIMDSLEVDTSIPVTRL